MNPHAADWLPVIRDGLAPTTAPRQRVIVIGAGIAGLVAAYELLRAGAGSLAGLDVPALVPQSGLVLVNVVDDTLGPDDLDSPPHEADELFALPDSPLVFSLYEPVYGSVEEAERDMEDRS